MNPLRKCNLCLSLLDKDGKELYSQWYSNRQSISSAKVRLAYLFKEGYTWIIWRWTVNGKRVLVSSSRPLLYEFISADVELL